MKPYVLVFTGAFVVFSGLWLGGLGLWMPPLVLFGLIPALDQFLSLDRDNTVGSRALRYLPMLFVPVHLALLGYGMQKILLASAGDAVLMTVDLGIASALAINVAHELMHRPGKVEQRLSEVLMSSVNYTHFCVEHVWGHHKNVATERDPATARVGETLYAYLPRTLVGSLKSAWSIEVERHGRGGQNRILRYGVVQLIVLAILGMGLGTAGIAAFLGQAAVAVLLLETINYVEHYGLLRKEIAPGRPERVQPHHSWNSSHRLSNWMLLNLARHSDHHAFAARSFSELRHYEDVPQLPASYSAMVLLAFVPPLWFRVMNPRVQALG